jgi:hypothetical protein
MTEAKENERVPVAEVEDVTAPSTDPSVAKSELTADMRLTCNDKLKPAHCNKAIDGLRCLANDKNIDTDVSPNLCLIK